MVIYSLIWLVVGCFGFKALRDRISVYIGPSPKDGEEEMRKER